MLLFANLGGKYAAFLHLASERTFTFSYVLTFPRQLTLVFLGEYWKETLRDLGRAVAAVCNRKLFSHITAHMKLLIVCCLARQEGRALFNMTVGYKQHCPSENRLT